MCHGDGSSDNFWVMGEVLWCQGPACAVRHAPLNHIEFAGIHPDPSFASEGTAIPKLAVRSDDRTAQTSGLSGCRSCSPHSLLRSERIRFIRLLIQSGSEGHAAPLRPIPEAKELPCAPKVVRRTVPVTPSSTRCPCLSHKKRQGTQNRPLSLDRIPVVFI